MHKIIGIVMITMVIISCNNQPKPTVDAKEAEKIVVKTDSTNKVGEVYKLDSLNSTLQWEGYEGLSLGKSEHNGTLQIKSGNINVVDNLLTSGAFKISIASLKVDDIPTSKPGNAKLVKHLLDADFFDAAAFPEATFEITKAETETTDSLTITGNLTLKGVSKSISFPAFVKISENNFAATSSKFYINRKDWGMHYHSENSLGDEMIRNEMGITINLMAKK